MPEKRKRICVVSFCNLYILPYTRTYVQSIIDNGDECTLLYWDRELNGGEKDRAAFPTCKHVSFMKYKPIDFGTKFYRVKTYLMATKFLRKHLKQGNYDGIVFLQTHAAIIAFDILHKYYAGKYIVDIRDYSLENIALFRYLEKRVLKEAYKVVISSPAYKKFLPPSEYIVAHNFTEFKGDKVNSIKNTIGKDKSVLTISFVGTVRFYDMDKRIINTFANDDRFKICYYGTGSDVLRDYSLEKGIRNVEFRGSFLPDQTLDFYEKTDLINNLYGNHNPFLDYALSNKLYHTIQLFKPILVCPDTYMEEVVQQYNLGFVVDINNPDTPQILWEQYQSFDWDSFKKGCTSFLNVIKSDTLLFNELCDSFAKI